MYHNVRGVRQLLTGSVAAYVNSFVNPLVSASLMNSVNHFQQQYGENTAFITKEGIRVEINVELF